MFQPGDRNYQINYIYKRFIIMYIMNNSTPGDSYYTNVTYILY